MEITRSYRSEDKVANLKVRITLKCIAGSIAPKRRPSIKASPPEPESDSAPEPEPEADASTPEPEPEQEPEPELTDAPGTGASGSGTQVYTRTIKWQEKIFSTREMNFYGSKQRHEIKNITAMSHWKMVQTIKEQGLEEDQIAGEEGHGGAERATGVISTYVDADSHWAMEQLARVDPDESAESMLAYHDGADVTSVARKMRQLNSTKKTAFDGKMTEAEKALYQDSAFSRMQVVASMASFGAEEEEGEGSTEEIVLCVIKAYKTGGKGLGDEATVLEMRPGFNSPECPTHRINHGGSAFDISVELVSEQSNDVDPDNAVTEQMARQKRRTENIMLLRNRSHPGVFKPMGLPSGNSWDVRMQLISAHGFDHDQTYVEYCWQLPPRWQLNKDMLGADYGADGTKALLSGCTQMADRCYERGDVLGLRPFCHFGLPSELAFRENARTLTKPTDRQWPSDQPCLFVKVCTVDWWQRYRLLGYGYVPMPTEPGTYHLDVQTWHPVHNRVEEMRSFFVGGSAEMDPLWATSADASPWAPNIAMPHVSEDFNGSYLNKFGFQTRTGGTVKIELNTVKRSKVKPAGRKAGLSNLLKKGRKSTRSKTRTKKNIMAGAT